MAALNYLDGKILSRTEGNHTHVEWLRFLKQIDQETPRDQEVHLIIDNYATHKHAKGERVDGAAPRGTESLDEDSPKAHAGPRQIEKLVAALRLRSHADPRVRERIRIEADYFEKNADRMRYPRFRKLHLFVGSGVIEAGCKTIITSCLKQSGMF